MRRSYRLISAIQLLRNPTQLPHGIIERTVITPKHDHTRLGTAGSLLRCVHMDGKSNEYHWIIIDTKL